MHYFLLNLISVENVNIIHISHSFDGDIPVYSPKDDRIARSCH